MLKCETVKPTEHGSFLSLWKIIGFAVTMWDDDGILPRSAAAGRQLPSGSLSPVPYSTLPQNVQQSVQHFVQQDRLDAL